MDGLLVIDKPAGPTSHTVVARVRHALAEPRIGHTGTLDPMATGVLPLVLGKATRLARFLNSSNKTYEAVIGLGVSTDTGDALGTPIGLPYDGELPQTDVVERALDAFRGTFVQQPPAYSAKKIDGRRSYALARKRARVGTSSAASAVLGTDSDTPVLPAPVDVTAHRLEILRHEGHTITLALECSAGFYVRSLAHDLGERLGTGAHLVALRRTRSGDLTLDHAIPLGTLERDPPQAIHAVIPLAEMLPALVSVTLTTEGVRHAVQGRELGSADITTGRPPTDAAWVRLFGPGGDLVAIAAPSQTPGLLHPAVVLM